jgi:hypothetical protein
MRQIEYSPLVKKKMARLQSELSEEYGKEKADDILRSMMDAVDHLQIYECNGREISKIYDIETDYWCR